MLKTKIKRVFTLFGPQGKTGLADQQEPVLVKSITLHYLRTPSVVRLAAKSVVMTTETSLAVSMVNHKSNAARHQ